MAQGDVHTMATIESFKDFITTSQTISENNANYFVDTSSGAITLTVDSSLNHFTVYDSHFNFSLNNCTVDFGSSTTKVLSTEGEIVVFFKDNTNAWRFISKSIGSGGSV